MNIYNNDRVTLGVDAGGKRSVIHLEHEEMILRFPRGDFTDTVIQDLRASKKGSDGGSILVQPWSSEQIARWHQGKARWDKYGHHIASVIKRAGY
jgi:hypothetical protein